MIENKGLPVICKFCFFGTSGNCLSSEVSAYAKRNEITVDGAVQKFGKRERCDFAHDKDPMGLSALQKGFKVGIRKSRGRYIWMKTLGPNKNISLQDRDKGKDE